MVGGGAGGEGKVNSDSWLFEQLHTQSVSTVVTLFNCNSRLFVLSRNMLTVSQIFAAVDFCLDTRTELNLVAFLSLLPAPRGGSRDLHVAPNQVGSMRVHISWVPIAARGGIPKRC